MGNKSRFGRAQAALVVVLGMPGLCLSRGVASQQSRPHAATPANSHTVVLPFSEVKFLFPKGTQSWTPKPGDIAQLEADLRKLVMDTPDARLPGSAPERIQDYYRQYIGVIQDGKKQIYVNAFRRSTESEFGYWRQRIVLVHDGGRSFCNFSYEVKERRFGPVHFHGEA